MKVKKYFTVWLRSSFLSLETVLTTKGSSLMFLSGKLVRFFFFLWLIIMVGDRVDQVAGYSLDQLIIAFLVFNLLDTGAQLLFRGLYWFRRDVTHGELDFKLIKPMSTLFQALTGRTDVLDIPMFCIIVVALAWRGASLFLAHWPVVVPLFLISGLLIFSIHVLVAALCVLTAEIDHTIMIYRDLSAMARIPIDAYITPIRILLTFIIPIAVMMTFPAKALFGMLGWPLVAFSLGIAGLFTLGSLKLWRYALTRYTSASS